MSAQSKTKTTEPPVSVSLGQVQGLAIAVHEELYGCNHLSASCVLILYTRRYSSRLLRASRRPIYDDLPWDTLELSNIGPHRRQPPAQCLRRDQHIVIADRYAACFQVGSNKPGLARILRVEWQYHDPRAQKPFVGSSKDFWRHAKLVRYRPPRGRRITSPTRPRTRLPR